MRYHLKYRPTSLNQIIGHSQAVETLTGWVSSPPSAILFTGPPSAGKTTLARAFAKEVLNQSLEGNPNWTELNLSENRSIEDVRSTIQIANLRPISAKHRFILGDEAQGILSNAPAGNALLKPLEEPKKTTTFMLSSMDADKFRSSTLGKAILSRCVKINLTPHSNEDLTKQCARILKGEGFRLPSDVRDAVIEAADHSMRNLANLVESLAPIAAKREVLTSDVHSVSEGESHTDDSTAARFLLSIYSRDFAKAQRSILNITDSVTFINRVTWISWFLLNEAVLNGERHPKAWGSKTAYEVSKRLKSLSDIPTSKKLSLLSIVNTGLVSLRLQSGAFSVDESLALSAFAFSTIEKLSTLLND